MKKALMFFILVSSLAILNGEDKGLGIVSIRKRLEQKDAQPGKRYAICIGINDYEDNEVIDLRKARNDARDFAQLLKKNGLFDHTSVMIDSLSHRDQNYPSLRNIKKKLKWLKSFIEPNDLVVFLFSGHGTSDGKGNSFLIPVDADFNDVQASSLTLNYLNNWIKEIKVKKSLLLIDACRETLTEAKALNKHGLQISRFKNAEVSAVFFATKDGWYSFEDAFGNYGIFTKYILQGLKGQADIKFGNKDGVVSFRELASYVEEEVSVYALSRGKKQKPYILFKGESFGDLGLSVYEAESLDIVEEPGPRTAGKEKKRVNRVKLRIYCNKNAEIFIDSVSYGKISGNKKQILDKEAVSGQRIIECRSEDQVLRKKINLGQDREQNLALYFFKDDLQEKERMGISFSHHYKPQTGESFWLSQTEITYGQFEEFLKDSAYRTAKDWKKYYPNKAFKDYPVSLIDYQDCLAYVRWFADKSGEKADLPTIEQWQFAAGGYAAYTYPWGNNYQDDLCHFGLSRQEGLNIGQSRGPIQAHHFIHDITEYKIKNLAGNMREWCKDSKENNSGILLAAVAGSSWKINRPANLKNTYIRYMVSHLKSDDTGFRIVLNE